MNFLRCLSVACTETYPRFGSDIFPKRIYENVKAGLSKSLMGTSRREIHKRFGKSKSYKAESQDKIPEDKNKLYVDEWFSQFLQRLNTSPDASFDWKSEFQDKPPKFSFKIMAKMISVQDYHEGMYWSGISLMEYLRSIMSNGSHYFGNIDILFLVNKISLAVHQKNDHSLALELFNDLLKKVTGDEELLLDHGSCSVLISALSKTTNWKECLKLLEASTILMTGSNNSEMCSDILEASIRENDDEVSQKMLDSIEEQDDVPSDKAFRAIVRHRPLSYLLKVLRDQRLIIKESVADDIKEFYEKSATVKRVKLNKSSCSGCGNSLLPGLKISNEEMEKLAETFSEKVFNGAFINQEPKLNEDFRKFLEAREKYDVVVKARNVLFRLGSMSTGEKYLKLFSVIKFFSNHGKRVLVLCRSNLEKELKSWVEQHGMDEENLVDWFFVNHRSQDELFLLYAGLCGNGGCIVVTQEELGNHRYLLGPEQARVFKRWQQKHQVVFEGVHSETAELIFKYPQSHEVVAHESSDGIVHIPYIDEGLENSFPGHTNSWLCIKDLTMANTRPL